jgi:hypothetical protein
MLYLLATIGVLVVALVVWRSMAPAKVGAGARRTLGPDDDPDFLRGLADQVRRRDDDDDPPG